MLIQNGRDLLQHYANTQKTPSIKEVCTGLWHVQNVGHSNAIIIEGEKGVILIDAMETFERGQALRTIITEKTGKQVHTIIFTHGHPDHRWGAGAFADCVSEIIDFAPKTAPLARSRELMDIQMLRGARQFGYMLTDEETITQGLGPREGAVYGEKHAPLTATTTYNEDHVERVIDGVHLQLVRLVGETDDQIAIWLPDQKVLCSGDNYYACFPNLYAIRGSQYRDIAAWIDSLDALIAFDAEVLLPGHTAPLIGADTVRETLSNYRNAIDYILSETLRGMNAGKTIDELASTIHLPEHLASLPYLGEHYGCTEWTVRAIYVAYLGWFDGNPTRLHPLPPSIHAEKTVALMGGIDAVYAAAQKAYKDADYQWCLELCDLLANCGDSVRANTLKADAMTRLADFETSGNGRHYYLACAHALRGE